MAVGEMRDFKSTQGTVVRAEAKKVRGQSIVLAKEDGTEIVVPLTGFSKDDQTYLMKWMVANPSVVEVSFSVRADEKTNSDTKTAQRDYARNYSSVGKCYNISILNNGKNVAQDITVDWCTFKLDHYYSYYYGYGDSDGSEPVGIGNTATGHLRMRRGTTNFVKIEPKQSVNFVTDDMRNVSTTYKYGSNRTNKDAMKGAWVRFYRGNKMIFEWKTSDCPKVPWPGGSIEPKAQPPRGYTPPRYDSDTTADGQAIRNGGNSSGNNDGQAVQNIEVQGN